MLSIIKNKVDGVWDGTWGASTKPCPVCGKFHHVLLKSAEQVEALHRWADGEGYIQDLCPFLNADEREVLISGTGAECWNTLFGGDDEDE